MKKSDLLGMSAEQTLTQYGALCYRWSSAEAGKIEILLVTSRDTGRWVLPKGWPMRGHTGPECALREAFEEAGVEGRPSKNPLGLYSYLKTLGQDAGVTCIVTVYPVAVDRLRRRFPESLQREREWFAPEMAASLVAEPELAEIMRRFAPPQAGPSVRKAAASGVLSPSKRT